MSEAATSTARDGQGEHRVVNALPDAASRRESPAIRLGADIYVRATDCVHCGLCLPACPTYTQNRLETDSPRGRIHLMKGLADGRIGPTDPVLDHLDLCLDCRACETACPSGVVYHELLEQTRQQLRASRRPGWVDRLLRVVFFHVFPQPTRLKLALLPTRVLQRVGLWRPLTKLLGPLLPTQLRKMQQMLPADGPLWESYLATFYAADDAGKADGRPRATVGFFAGCVGSVLFQDVNRKAIALLNHLGCDVVVPREQACCGAIHHHGGEPDGAQRLAVRNLLAFETGPGGRKIDHVVTAIAGCGAALREYDHLLRHAPRHAEAAARFVGRVSDISELLAGLLGAAGTPRPAHAVDRTVTYHDACHLLHAQRVADPPRQLLAAISGLKVVPLTESDICCGAAGTYNLAQPAMATELAERKLRHIAATGAKTCVTGNVGCAMQIDSEARRMGMDLRVVHPVELLYEAYFGRAV